ncbi:MAG: hypothetical protein DRN29_01895 [Thermoplasmata archaeon]|nr:MAG: hypothetical protein DRN29_01895 [Thermoplasmata archaeon]
MKGNGFIVLIVICAIFASAFIAFPSGRAYTYNLKTFSSYEEMVDFLKNNFNKFTSNKYYVEELSVKNVGVDTAGTYVTRDSNIDFSRTNVQVEGVDEPDIVKTDGTYIYLVANQKIYIIRAYPPENASILSKINMGEDIHVENIFINENNLIVFGNSYRTFSIQNESFWSSVPTTVIKIYDVTNKSSPQITKEIEIDGAYFGARMLKNYVYVISQEYYYSIYYILDGNVTVNIPEMRINNETTKVPPSCIYYMDMPYSPDSMVNVMAINLSSGDVTQKSFLIGNAQTLYVSQNNIFLASQKYDVHILAKAPSYYDREKTIIYRISIKNGDILYEAQGEVLGYVLNQFSMDEYNGFFRIATTAGSVWNGNSSNNIYILNENLSIVGKIENIAPGERIYSARFMGNRAYLVTFKKVDPFFTIDLSNPYNPKILGKLKIPGYSDYLHPYDENHIIGIGKETVEAMEGDFAWYQGLKIVLFNVSNPEEPIEMSKVVIGDRGTDSPVLHDHKALLFDREKGIFIIPVAVYEIDDEIKARQNYTGNMYGEFTFQGAYVYKISLENGFEYKGRITHMGNESNETYYYWYSPYFIKRCLYIDNVLYTISDKIVKMNDMDTLNELGSIMLD